MLPTSSDWWLPILNLLAGLVQAFSAVIMVWLTYVLIRLTKRLNDSQLEPKLEVSYVIEEGFPALRIRVRNIGGAGAKKIRFKFDPIAAPEASEEMLREFFVTKFFERGIEYLGPGDERSSTWISVSKDFDKRAESTILVTLSYDTERLKNQTDKYLLRFDEIEGMPIDAAHDRKIASSLDKISTAFDRIQNSGKLNINVYTRADRDRDRAEREEAIDRIQSQNSLKMGQSSPSDE